MIRNTRALAGLKLPPRHAATVVVDPTPAEEELYTRLSALVRAHHRGGQGNGALDRLTLRLLQSEAGSSPAAVEKTLRALLAASGSQEDSAHAEMRELAEMAGTFRTSTKVARLADILDSTREQTIVFITYLETVRFVSRELEARGLRPVLFHGRMSSAEKDGAIERFRSGERVLVATEVGGEGRNLQFCHRMVNFDLPWNPMRIEQRIGRLHRIGQESEIEILNLCARGSVEDHLLGILDRKINMFELVIGEIDMILGQLADDRDFSERVLDTWATAATDEEAAAGFDRLSGELITAKHAYERVKALDESLFGEDFEVLRMSQ
jgi:SNF2 family DNA or RNA helicase